MDAVSHDCANASVDANDDVRHAFLLPPELKAWVQSLLPGLQTHLRHVRDHPKREFDCLTSHSTVLFLQRLENMLIKDRIIAVSDVQCRPTSRIGQLSPLRRRSREGQGRQREASR
ncbi:hypothetical protein BAUCODRAFT_122082 [Baudoinia panamericana UAMH 10762]|uniref:Uncharacterized protein n=1 Tax=Baudoinia panamericana (strain UAMH 10762) TaxID=717646 RepID=M2NF99_BAUPA|nr:uncharacterized protein BAUCODRAFT_122082 [Baudoinia panamericana UAMH 10762]EMC97655.1 hypothetical protein BAUCODRAFT_122082 [Baudoinia panamericana UAMH 10762]